MTPTTLPWLPEWLGFAHAWAFGLLALLPLLWWLWTRPSRRPVLRFSDLGPLREAGGIAARRARAILPALRSVALIALIVAVARPQRADESTRVFAEGVAIQLVIDTSLSMRDTDLSPTKGDKAVTRLDVVKDVVRRFVAGDPARGLPGRPDDLIGLIRFARYADSRCPLTLDHRNLLKAIDDVTFAGGEMLAEMEELEKRIEKRPLRQATDAERRRYESLARALNMEQGTAIGAGLALAVERLHDLKRTVGSGERLTIKSRVVILLTDGENNIEEIASRSEPDPALIAMPPVEAGKLAAASGIKVYTILAGTGEVEYRRMLDGTQVPVGRLPVRDDDLVKIAEMTGGKHYRATDADALADVYREIGELERTRTEERRYLRWGELSLPWLVVAFAALSLQTLLEATRLRKIP